MKIFVVLLLLSILLFGCSDKDKSPDVSDIKVDITVERFDKDFFSMDTIGIEKALRDLEMKYPSMYPIFINNILGLDDSARDQEVVRFIRQNQFIADAAGKEFENTEELKKEFEQAFRYVKYYFTIYPLPKLITIVGPPDALAQTPSGDQTPNFIGPDFLGLSLQFYLGKDFAFYQDKFFIANIAPEYRSRRFDKKYLVADAMKLIVDDINPDKSPGKGLIEQMIEKGKQWWLLDKFLPKAPDSIKTGYTKHQLNWCKEYEGLIWQNIISNERDLYTKNPEVIKNYIGEGPTSPTMPGSSPGNIGQWVGWQIVRKFATNNSSMTVEWILQTPAQKIFEAAKYKPK